VFGPTTFVKKEEKECAMECFTGVGEEAFLVELGLGGTLGMGGENRGIPQSETVSTTEIRYKSIDQGRS